MFPKNFSMYQIMWNKANLKHKLSLKTLNMHIRHFVSPNPISFPLLPSLISLHSKIQNMEVCSTCHIFLFLCVFYSSNMDNTNAVFSTELFSLMIQLSMPSNKDTFSSCLRFGNQDSRVKKRDKKHSIFPRKNHQSILIISHKHF